MYSISVNAAQSTYNFFFFEKRAQSTYNWKVVVLKRKLEDGMILTWSSIFIGPLQAII